MAARGDDSNGQELAPLGIDLALLLPFVVLADEMHFGRAAARLHVSQSALSQQIQRLERQLGVQLFVRDSRRVSLAGPGHVLLAGARNALDVVTMAVQEARIGPPQITIRVGVDIHLPDALLAHLRRFGASRPDLLVRLRIQQQDDVISDLESTGSDLAILWTAPPADSAALAHTVLAAWELFGVVRADDPLGSALSLDRAALASRQLALYRPSRETRAFYDSFLNAFTMSGGPMPHVAHVPVLDDAQSAMLDMVEQTGGFTVCPSGNFSRFGRPNLVAIPFDPPLFTDVVVVWRGTRRPAEVDDLVKFMAVADLDGPS